MALAVNLHAHDDPADGDLALFDPVEYGLLLRLQQTGSSARARLIAGLQAAGLLRSGHPRVGPLRLTIEVPIRDDAITKAKAVLHLTELEDGLVITSGSSIKMNLQQALRARHRIPDSVVALNGDRNFSKPTAECDQSDLEVQLEAIGRCVDLLLRAILGSLPGCVIAEDQLLLRKAEVGHDLICRNAEDVTRATCRVPLAGSRLASHTDYRFTVEAGGSPTWHFTDRKRGPMRKGYAKLRGLLRTELSCLHRDAVVWCVGHRRHAAFSFNGAVELALDFYHAAGKLCCDALDHVRAVSLGGRTMQELLVQMDGFRAIAERRRTGDGYTPSVDAAADAQRVLNALLSDGIVHAKGLRKGTKVRDELERLVAPGGPLVRGATPGVYCLAPEYGLALPGLHLREVRE